MSSTPTSELNDADCEKGHVYQRPSILYALSKDETSMTASRETIKMKTPEGEVKVAVLGDSPGPEEYLQHINNFIGMLERKRIKDDLLKLAKAVISPRALMRKLKTAPPGEFYQCSGVAEVVHTMSSQKACKVQYLSTRDSNGDPKQISGTAPND
jgi:hypothetical protein